MFNLTQTSTNVTAVAAPSGSFCRNGIVGLAAGLVLGAAMLLGAVPPAKAETDTSLRSTLGVSAVFNRIPPCQLARNCAPARKALLVLMENGGYKSGLPVNFGITVYRCSTLHLGLGPSDNLVNVIGQIAGQIGGAVQCLDPRNWSAERVPLTRYVEALDSFTQNVTDTVLEDIGRSVIDNSRAREVYDRVEILEDADFSKSAIRAKLAELAPTHVIDVHVLAHGAVDGIGPHHADPGEDMTAASIAGLRDIPNLRLRAVYQQNCFGQFLRDEWVAAGAKVVNGSRHLNYMSFGYESFLRRWLDGAQFGVSVQQSFSDWLPFYTQVFAFVDLYTHPTARTARLRNPPLFSIFGTLGASDEINASTMLFTGNTGLRVSN